MSSFSLKVANRYLCTKRKEAFISIISIVSLLGIAIGVGVLNIVMAIMTGFEYELKNKIIGANSHIIVKRSLSDILDSDKIEEKISKVKDVKTVSPFIYRQGLLKYKDRTIGMLIKGLKEGSDASKKLFENVAGNEESVLYKKQDYYDASTNHISSLPVIIIGKQLSMDLGLYRGAIVTLLSSSLQSSPFGLMPKYKRFIVGDIYSSGLSEYESGLVYVDIKEAQSFFEMKDRVSGFEIFLNDLDAAPIVANNIDKELKQISPYYFTQTWLDLNRPLWEALQLEKKTYFIVLLLIIIMASFSVVTTLVMIVLEKRKDVAVLKTLGATTNDIAKVFVSMGVVIGFFGTVLGVILGMIGCICLEEFGFPLDARVFPVDRVPVKVEVVNVVVVSVSSFLISLLATIYPATRASKLNPSEVLRYE
ncbi:MAG: FtsX-like permease family protein [Bdellovibrionota bacterium]